MTWYFYIALKQLFPSGRKLSLMYLLPVLGVATGVWLLVVVQSVMGGFGHTYREKIIQTNGHIRIESSGIIYRYWPVLELLEGMPDKVKAVEPYAQGVVMIQHQGRPSFPFIRGIDPFSETPVIPFQKFLQVGTLEDLDDDSVLLSNALARKIGIGGAGETIEVFTPLMIERLKRNEVLLPREFRVAGIYQTGWSDFDSNTMVCTLRTMQDLYGLDDGIHGIAVLLRDHVNEMRFARELEPQISPPFRAVTWIEMYQDFLWVLQLEKNMMFILLIPIVMGSAFTIMVVQLLTVLRKIREIGLLNAIGGKPLQLIVTFCFQGFVAGLLGTALGVCGALVFLHYRDAIVGFFARLTESQDVLVKFYQFSRLPVHYNPTEFVIICVSALLLSTLAGLIPAFYAISKNPAEALRSE